jgi:hypothetical protein
MDVQKVMAFLFKRCQRYESNLNIATIHATKQMFCSPQQYRPIQSSD